MTDFDPVDFLSDAVKIESHEDVDEMRKFVIETLEKYGENPETDEVGNLIVSKGEGDKNLVLNTHLDTVNPHVEFRETKSRIYGRGACDAKGPLAAFLGAYLDAEPEGEVTLALVPNEETSSEGAYHLLESPKFDGDDFIVGEPTELDVCNMSRGRFDGEICIRGESAHASQPENGLNAIGAIGDIYHVAENYGEGMNHKQLGEPTLALTMAEAGSANNVLAEEAKLTFDRRSIPGEEATSFQGDFKHAIQDRVDSGYEIEVKLTDRETPFLEAFYTDSDSSVVKALEVSGAGDTRSFGAVAESSYFSKMGDTVIFGPGSLDQAHSPGEYVNKEQVYRCAELLSSAIDNYFEE
ncbi:MAG: M20/M25/M40 family metallo-hydrolase [Candidatus Nanohaloarchaea archaeon]